MSRENGRDAILLCMSADAPNALDRIVDDETPRREALVWAVEQVERGRTFEDVTTELVTNGWSADDATEIVEAARVATLELRGAITRDQVVRAADRRYRRSMTVGWFVGFPTIAAAVRLLYSVSTLLFLRRTNGWRDRRT
jgi:hypothetical protein